MICLRCHHTSHPDAELETVEHSANCLCPCHPWNDPPCACGHTQSRHGRDRNAIQLGILRAGPCLLCACVQFRYVLPRLAVRRHVVEEL